MEGKGELGAGGESQKLREICHVSSRKGGKIDKRRKKKQNSEKEKREEEGGKGGEEAGREERVTNRETNKEEK